MSYNLLLPIHLITAGSMAGNITSNAVEVKYQDNIGLQLHWIGAPVGTFSVQISTNHREDAEGNIQVPGNWVTLALNPGITASGTPDDAYIDVNQTSAMYMRLLYNFTSGTGTLDAYAVAKGI